MKRLTYILFLVIAACGQASDSQDNLVITDTEIYQDENTLNWTRKVYNKVKDIEHLFVKRDLRQYDCYDLQKYYLDQGTKLSTEGLTEVGAELCSKLFGDYTNDYGTLCGSYLFSIDRPIHELYPITIIQYFGVAERPVVMVLFNDQGEIVNTLEVADLYGESGGCLKSEFINDSTLIQNYQWDDFGTDTLTNQDIWETTYMTQETTIKSNGEIIKKELKRWTETTIE